LANQITILLEEKNSFFQLGIHDNGKGFSLEKTLAPENIKRGIGLSSMKERAELSGGSFFINSSKSLGTIIKVSWPKV